MENDYSTGPEDQHLIPAKENPISEVLGSDCVNEAKNLTAPEKCQRQGYQNTSGTGSVSTAADQQTSWSNQHCKVDHNVFKALRWSFEGADLLEDGAFEEQVTDRGELDDEYEI